MKTIMIYVALPCIGKRKVRGYLSHYQHQQLQKARMTCKSQSWCTEVDHRYGEKKQVLKTAELTLPEKQPKN